MDIDIKRQFDQTDPFALAKDSALRFGQWQDRIRRVRKDVPPEVWEQLVDQAVAQGQPTRTPQLESAVHLSTVEVPAWDAGRSVDQLPPTVIYRRPRVARHVSWQWRLIAAGIRLGRRLRRITRKHLRRTLKTSRRLLRRVLPRRRPMRGARAR
jgi:hypothetical protein